MSGFVAAEAFPPGEYLKDQLEARGWTQDDLADVTGISRRQIINLIAGKSGITLDTAIALAQAFGQDAKTWMHLQVSYELALAANEDREIARRAQIFNKVPVREMRRRKWIANVDETDQLESEICKFLEISAITETPRINKAARHGLDYGSDSPAQIAWYFQVRHRAKQVTAAKYQESAFGDCVVELLKLAAYAEDVRRVPRVLADFGIRLVLVQHLKGTKIDGVATWLEEESVPVIGLSLRYDRIDNFWFSLFHEAMHIKHRDKSPVDVDITGENASSIVEMEKIANEEAAATLIAPEKMDSFVTRHRPLFYQKEVVRFALARGVHPAIVVGQLKHRRELSEDRLNGLQAKIREHIIGAAATDGWGNEPASDQKGEQ
jgi:HTH-type transcriptional regulator/antitoxin HigA